MNKLIDKLSVKQSAVQYPISTFSSVCLGYSTLEKTI